jgi:hypothetical protein
MTSWYVCADRLRCVPVADDQCKRVLKTHESNVSRSFMPPDPASAEREQECRPSGDTNFPSPLSGPSRAPSPDRCLSPPSLPAQPSASLPEPRSTGPPSAKQPSGNLSNQQTIGNRPRFTSESSVGSPTDCILTKGPPPVPRVRSVSLSLHCYGRTKKEPAEEVVLPKRSRIDRISYAIAQLCLCGVEVIMAGCTSENSGSTQGIRNSSVWEAVLQAKRELDVIMTEPCTSYASVRLSDHQPESRSPFQAGTDLHSNTSVLSVVCFHSTFTALLR